MPDETYETYECPVCNTETPMNELFLKQDQGTSIQPIICINCVAGFYHSIQHPIQKGETN